MFNNTTETETEIPVRVARGILDILSHRTIYEPSVSGSHSQIHVNLGDKALSKENDSPAQAGMKAASKLIEDGGDFIRAPMTWLKDMQANWHIYMVCAAIICFCILFFYCLVRTYLARKRNGTTGFPAQFVDMALCMAPTRTNHGFNHFNPTKPIPGDFNNNPK
jgi:hypothetical protein